MKKTVVAAVVLPLAALGLSACSTATPKGKAQGTFPYCSYQPVEDGVLVPEENKAPCVVDDAREADDRSGYNGTHVIVVPRTGTRTPLPITPTSAKTTPATKKTLAPAPKTTASTAKKTR
jgi:hypothetical protein